MQNITNSYSWNHDINSLVGAPVEWLWGWVKSVRDFISRIHTLQKRKQNWNNHTVPASCQSISGCPKLYVCTRSPRQGTKYHNNNMEHHYINCLVKELGKRDKCYLVRGQNVNGGRNRPKPGIITALVLAWTNKLKTCPLVLNAKTPKEIHSATSSNWSTKSLYQRLTVILDVIDGRLSVRAMFWDK